MSIGREKTLKSSLEGITEELRALRTTVDTICLGLERENIEPQATAALKVIGMSLSHIQQIMVEALNTEQ